MIERAAEINFKIEFLKMKFKNQSNGKYQDDDLSFENLIIKPK